MFTHDQEQMHIIGANALREWTGKERDVPPDDWRLVEGIGATLISSAAGCQGQWGNFGKIVHMAIIAIYNIGVARGKHG